MTVADNYSVSRACFFTGNWDAGPHLQRRTGWCRRRYSLARSQEKTREKSQLLQHQLITCFSYFYGLGGQQNFLLTSYYVVFVKIIGLYVDFKSRLRTLWVLIRSSSNLKIW